MSARRRRVLAALTVAPLGLTGWTLRYYSASGTTSQTTSLSGQVVAGGRYLVKQADGANTSLPALPTPDATGTVPMSSSGARVEIVRPDGQVADRLGWGAATTAEGAAADATSNETSVARTDVCVDTDNNAADFAVGAPTPQNSSTTPVVCEPDDGGEPPVDEPETITQIQGSHHISSFDGAKVNGVEGVVTAVSSSGFWLQSTTPDDDEATSEGIFVYTRSKPTVAVGDTASVDGVVDEFRPGGSSGWDNLTTIEIVSPVVTRTGTGEVPAPVVLGEDRVAPQQTIDAEDPKSVEYAEAAFRPDRDAIDFYESMEGMQVAVRDAQVVGPTGYEIPVVPASQVEATRSSAGGVVYGGYDQPNAMRVLVDDVLLPSGSLPDADVRDRLPGLVAGPLDYSFANFKLLATQVPTVEDGGLEREVTQPQHDRELSVASFNVENLAPGNDQSKFDRLAGQVVTNLRSPDVIAVEEVQDNSGPTDDGTVDSSATTDKLIAAIESAGGPTYEAHWVDPQDKSDGGQPGGNIRNVLLHRTDRDIDFVERSAGAADHAADVVADKKGAHLTESPGRIAPSSAAFDDSRKPLVGEYRYRGERVFVAAVHFSSKGGDDPLFGRWQQPVRSSEDARHDQAREVRAFADDLLAADPKAKLVVAGDVNDFEFSETSDILADIVEGSGSKALTDLPRTLPESERWTYVYEGNSQVLDHIFVSPTLATLDKKVGPFRPGKGKRPAFTYDIVHTNSPFADQDSDHDPQVVHLDLKK